MAVVLEIESSLSALSGGVVFGCLLFFISGSMRSSKLVSCPESWFIAMVVVQSVSSCKARVISDKFSSSVQTSLSIPPMIEVRSGPCVIGGLVHFLILVFVCFAAFLTKSYLTLAKGVKFHCLFLVHITSTLAHCPILVYPF